MTGTAMPRVRIRTAVYPAAAYPGVERLREDRPVTLPVVRYRARRRVPKSHAIDAPSRGLTIMSIQEEVQLPTDRRVGLFDRVKAIVTGLMTTADEAVRGQRVTQMYPEDHYTPFPRWR